MTDTASVEGLKRANADLEFALDNCRRAVAGKAPRTRAEYERDRLGLGSGFGDVFGSFFGTS
ncbi:hypothetical protein QLQ75_gp43 [Gordonia phage Santhid]|uniref:Uncharacterized protein n=1 Tax=Gordonia phage Santhid TaxID=2927281 RepID=A0AAE9GKD9_9CAUD|nr:hypothetical protein QLQ75_gp43 [Gordonia phage Santhid]UOK18037.1 hypothetical protein SEA_SANTHID_43 [Gordonia phage Santhid]